MQRPSTVIRATIAAATAAILAVGTLAAGGCGGESSNSSSSPATTAASATGLSVLALGDSETTGSGDPTGVGWAGRYAKLIKAHLTNLAQEGKTSQQLLSDVRSDPAARKAIENAQVILFGIGGADLNAGDDNFASGKCRAEACYAPVLKSFARNFDATVATVKQLRGSKPTVLRAITQPNVLTGAEDVIPPFLKPVATKVGVYQARTAQAAICQVMAKYGGKCIELQKRFNGPQGTGNAYKTGLLNHDDCCYPSAKGQQLMAQLLYQTGLAPVR